MGTCLLPAAWFSLRAAWYGLPPLLTTCLHSQVLIMPHALPHISFAHMKRRKKARRALQHSLWPPARLTEEFYQPHFQRMSRYWGCMRSLGRDSSLGRSQPRCPARRNAGAFRAQDASLLSPSARFIMRHMHRLELPNLPWSASNVIYVILKNKEVPCLSPVTLAAESGLCGQDSPQN